MPCYLRGDGKVKNPWFRLLRAPCGPHRSHGLGLRASVAVQDRPAPRIGCLADALVEHPSRRLTPLGKGATQEPSA
ncbi:unnamed protein product, partial [marine sediment metagenome]